MNHDVDAHLREIRAGLPGQLRQQRLRAAALEFGPLYSLDDIHRRIAHTLPSVLGCVRRTRVTPIERARMFIPEDALLRYDEAAQHGVFARFLVATPAYYWRSQPAAWLIAEVDGTDRWVVLAHWRAPRDAAFD